MTLDLPTKLALPLPTGRPYWYWLGGRPALDFVNTLRERWQRRVECLVTPDDLSRWLSTAGLVSGRPTATLDDLAAARRLREAIDMLVGAAVEGRPSPRTEVAEIDEWLAREGVRTRLVTTRGGPRLVEAPAGNPIEAALATIAFDAARMLGTDERSRIRVCASPSCSARFYDRSPPGRRRWCSMSECGNRAKARRHRERETS